MNPELIKLIIQFAPVVFDCIRDMDQTRASRVSQVLRGDHAQSLLKELEVALDSNQIMGGTGD